MKNSASKKPLRKFGILLGFGIPIIFGWILPAISGHIFRTWTLWVGVPALILGIIKPKILLYPYNGWIALGHALGWINSRIILGLIFLFLLQPIALIMRAFGYDPLRKKKGNKKNLKIIVKKIKI